MLPSSVPPRVPRSPILSACSTIKELTQYEGFYNRAFGSTNRIP
jgi:hypothetical protein